MLFSVNSYKKLNYFFVIAFFFIVHGIHGYRLPGVNLGFSNVLDGGPIRPYSGVYWFQYTQYYHSHKFLNGEGKLLGGVPSPSLNNWAEITQLAYQFDKKLFFGGVPGFAFTLPIVLSSQTQPNLLGITNYGAGLDNIGAGIYSQWSAIMRKDRPIFIHRLEFDINFPAGKNNSVVNQISPGSNFFYFDFYWAATLYFTRKFGLSWRAYYLWNEKDKELQTKAGDVFFVNYSLEYQLFPKFFGSLVGYCLKQLRNDEANGREIPDTKERIFGIGPGIAYFFSPENIFFSYLYGEFGARNRPQGISFIMRFIKHF